jgi:AbrB family looped-hinge helix DNA binding protein
MPHCETWTARVSSKGRISIPKRLREKLGLDGGTDVALREEDGTLILRKVSRQSWRRWEGRLAGSRILEDLAGERRRERRRDAKRS